MSEKDYAELKAENEKLKEQIIKLSEENGNLIIRANTCSNNYRDTQRRLDELCKANIHNLALLSKANKTLQEIKAIAEEWMKDYCYLDNFKDEEGCSICHENKDCYSYRLLKALTKAEEE